LTEDYRKKKVMPHIVTVSLKQEADYKFSLNFGEGIPVIYGDESPPLGAGEGPTPVQLLAAAVGNCLSASLLFALRKYKQSPDPIHTEATATVERNAENLLRVTQIKVVLKLGKTAAELENVDRAVEQFEKFCTVTESVRLGIPVEVSVFDSAGRQLK